MTGGRKTAAGHDQRKVQFIEEEGVRKYAVLLAQDYDALVEAAEMGDDVRAFDEAKASSEEFVPLELSRRLIAGDNPIRVWRAYRGMTQAALAAQAGIGQPFLSQLENGKRSPSIALARRIARALALDIEEIIDWLGADE